MDSDVDLAPMAVKASSRTDILPRASMVMSSIFRLHEHSRASVEGCCLPPTARHMASEVRKCILDMGKVPAREVLCLVDGLPAAAAISAAMIAFNTGRRTVERALTELSWAGHLERSKESADRRFLTFHVTNSGRDALGDPTHDIRQLRLAREDAKRHLGDANEPSRELMFLAEWRSDLHA
jgi:hypothetical protein